MTLHNNLFTYTCYVDNIQDKHSRKRRVKMTKVILKQEGQNPSTQNFLHVIMIILDIILEKSYIAFVGIILLTH